VYDFFLWSQTIEPFCHKNVKKMEKQTIHLTDKEVIIKRYKIRATGNQNASIETTIPREAFEREARRQGMTIIEALRDLTAVWRFNSFRGLHLSFEPKQQKGTQRSKK